MMRLTGLTGQHEAHHLLYEAAQRSRADNVPFLTAIREHPMLAARDLPADFAQSLEAAACVGLSSVLATETVARVMRT